MVGEGAADGDGLGLTEGSSEGSTDGDGDGVPMRGGDGSVLGVGSVMGVASDVGVGSGVGGCVAGVVGSGTAVGGGATVGGALSVDVGEGSTANTTLAGQMALSCQPRPIEATTKTPMAVRRGERLCRTAIGEFLLDERSGVAAGRGHRS
jgi:hypothetical protein